MTVVYCQHLHVGYLFRCFTNSVNFLIICFLSLISRRRTGLGKNGPGKNGPEVIGLVVEVGKNDPFITERGGKNGLSHSDQGC